MKEKNEMKEMKEKREVMERLLDILATGTNDPKLVYYNTQNKLNRKLHLIGMNIEIISDKQYEELTNMVTQFSNVIDDFLTENNIELKEEK
jgi:hypothetical protein